MLSEQAYQTARERAVFFDLSDYGKIELTGPEAVQFLHNLCTNDIKNLPAGGCCEAFLCTAKARTIAYLTVNRTRTGLLLVMIPSLAAKVLQHLDKHLISERVEITDRTQELTLLRLTGPSVPTTLSTLPSSAEIFSHRQLGQATADVICPVAEKTECIQKLQAAGVEAGSPELYEVLRIETGTPEYGKDMDDERFVMEVGRTSQAICYTKGCYLGQEPIVMARDRGHVNRTLLGVKVVGSGENPAKTIQPGSKLFHGDAEVGVVTSSVFSLGRDQAIGLAYLKRGSQDAGTELTIDPSHDGRKAIVALLPFVS